MMHAADALKGNRYPGRGIYIGKSPSGKNAVMAYFIMGRSENSRNRIFKATAEGIKTEAFDPKKLTDPSLIIYSPVRVFEKTTIVTNGDQTDTVYDFLANGGTFEAALRTRTFEPDSPNFTPRISGAVYLENGFSYKLSILKSLYGDASSAQRFFFEYDGNKNGWGHLIHTYKHDGDPIPSFEGEPKAAACCDDIDSFTNDIWHALDSENKVSLFVRYIDISSTKSETRIINANN